MGATGISGIDSSGAPGGGGGGANGAAIYNSGSLWVTRSTFASNVVSGGGGGWGGAGVTFGSVGGSGGGGGGGGSGLGGVLFNSGVAGLANCTIAFNLKAAVGGSSVGTQDSLTEPLVRVGGRFERQQT